MEELAFAERVRALASPAAYRPPAGRVDVIETHMSWVFLTEARAYKLKKPGRFDDGTVEVRRHRCAQEVELNRRLAASVYLGVVPVVRDEAGALRVGGDGQIVDWLVHMRRLAADRMLDAQIDRGTVRDRDVVRAARVLAGFYRRAPAAGGTGPAYRRDLAASIAGWRDELCAPLYGIPAAEVTSLAEDLLGELRRQPAAFEARAGRVVDAHGDLRPEHVCLEDPPVFIDCLEFSRALRLLDPVSELSFLALECERLGAPAVGRRFLAIYSAETGDLSPPGLIRFYRGFHGGIRAMLAARHLRDTAEHTHPAWRERARAYLRLARASTAG